MGVNLAFRLPKHMENILYMLTRFTPINEISLIPKVVIEQERKETNDKD